MMRFQAVGKPANFDQRVVSAVARARAHFTVARLHRLKKPPKGKKARKLTKFEWDELWGDFKNVITQATYEKCGYCEGRVIGLQRGDVEHFAPKGEIWALKKDSSTWGKEIPGTSNLKDRRHDLLFDQGYWWRAYDWTNYLLACAVCNEVWKLSFFPVQPDLTQPPDETTTVQPLLLHPFEGPDPSEHLRFGGDGSVSPLNGSIHGFETIRTCGLDRAGLRLARREKADRAYYLVRELANAADAAAIGRTLHDLFALGRPEYDYCGMVRAIFQQETGKSWADLVRLVQTRPASGMAHPGP